MAQKLEESHFDVVIKPPRGRLELDLHELWDYRDMLALLVRREFVANYKQSILGPAWAVVQPIISSLILAFTFGNLAGLSPSGIPTFLFYMAGQIAWQFFSGCITSTSKTYINNLALMSKVYFPRFVVPLASVLSQLLSLGIKCVLFFIFYLGYKLAGADIAPDPTLALIPLYLLHIGILGLGAGALLSSFTTKYRDVMIIVDYGITLWMYLTPILYDYATIPASALDIYLLNPLTPIFIHIQSALFGGGMFYWGHYLISLCISIALLIIGYRVFNRTARTFVDTI